MNPGVISNIIMIVLVILILTGWGAKTLRDGHLSPKLAACGLILYVFCSGLNFAGPLDGRWNFGGTLFPVLLTLWSLTIFQNWQHRLQYLLGVLTVSVALLVLLTLVPLDPAFFILDPDLLYPFTAVIISVLSVKRPFVALSIACVGLMISGSVDPILHRAFQMDGIVFGGGEIRDMLALTGAGVLAVHGFYHTGANYVQSMVKGWRERRSEGGPEHA
ncbi:hypothetical protein CIG75_09375 [Tumebacillus algifaecis]|uniref:Uncharacterized protein n=1 Tax=Tumebacillus algifaecis TaxID=1214604 RepID=A0A223D0T9_9BACL|nr:hypothetical protein [Tumebacillus algifaecis]ASS75171.1 hypothetical protein CIG75_09375 [Tumebacillus algifaecis]